MRQSTQRRSSSLLYLLVGLIAVFYLLNLRSGHDWGDDFSLYILHAQNLVSGVDYANTGYLYNPEQPDYSPQAYPPVFPLMLAPLVVMFGVQLAGLKLVGLVCFIAFLSIFARLVAELDLPAAAKVLLVAALGLHPLFWSMTDRILSDLPFLLVCTLALTQIQVFIIPGFPLLGKVSRSQASQFTQMTLTGILIYLAYGTRTAGIVLLPVLLAMDLLKNRRLSLLTVGAAAIAAVLIAMQAFLVPETGSYFDTLQGPFREQISRMTDFLRFYHDSFSHLFPFRQTIIRHILFDIALVLALIGYLRRLRKRLTVIEVFVPAYLGLVLAWPAFQGMRFLIPVLAFFLIYVFEGTAILIQKFSLKKQLQLAIFAGFLAILALSYNDGRNIAYFQRIDDIGLPETQQLLAYIREATPQDAVIVFYKPRALRLFTGRRAMTAKIPPLHTPVLDQIRAENAQFLVVEWSNPYSDQPDWQAFAVENPQAFTRVFENSRFQVFRIAE